jgi:hypothetical protein
MKWPWKFVLFSGVVPLRELGNTESASSEPPEICKGEAFLPRRSLCGGGGLLTLLQ